MNMNLDFLTHLEIHTKEDMLDEQGNPKQEVEIHENKLVCHPSMKEKVKEGMKLLEEISKNKETEK